MLGIEVLFGIEQCQNFIGMNDAGVKRPCSILLLTNTAVALLATVTILPTFGNPICTFAHDLQRNLFLPGTITYKQIDGLGLIFASQPTACSFK